MDRRRKTYPSKTSGYEPQSSFLGLQSWEDEFPDDWSDE
jgi:hypothetical protein